MSNSNNTSEIRLEIESEDDSTNENDQLQITNNNNSRTILSILSTNNQQIISNVLAPILDNQRIRSFTNFDQQPTSPTHTTNQQYDDNIPQGPGVNQDQEQSGGRNEDEEQYIVIWATVLKTLIRLIPLVLILLLKCTFENFQVIVEILLLHLVTWYLNLKYKGEVAKKTQRSQARLAILLLYILAVIHILLIYLISDTTSLGLFLVYSDTNVTLSTLFYQVIITDFILKLVTIFVKICITILPLKWIHFKQRSRSYAFIEHVSQFYRGLAPLHIWLDYFFFAYNGWKTVFGGLFCSLYLSYKGLDLIKLFRATRKSFLTLYRNVVGCLLFLNQILS